MNEKKQISVFKAEEVIALHYLIYSRNEENLPLNVVDITDTEDFSLYSLATVNQILNN